MNFHSRGIHMCWLTCCLLLVGGWGLHAQPLLKQLDPHFANIHHAGEQALLRNEPRQALRHFKKVLKKYPAFAPAWRSAGTCYRLLARHAEAAEAYRHAIEANPFHSRVLYFETAEALFAVGQYEEAARYYVMFDSLRQVPDQQFTYNGVEEKRQEQQCVARLSACLHACRMAIDRTLFAALGQVENLGPDINSSADEYFPYLDPTSQVLLFTSRSDAFSDENVFYTVRDGKGWKARRPLDALNTPGNEGMATLSRNGRQLLFTACQREGVRGSCDLWEARLDGLEVLGATSAPGPLNSESWESQASLSCDGRELYFASLRPGGHGGADIWYARRSADGSWEDPVNLGPAINTPGDEEAPFITYDGQTLFFSSTGHAGFGEQDLFFCRRQPDGSWGPPVNLGPPINSPARELGLFLSNDGRTGFFASNRPGGHGGMDIYRFVLSDALYSRPTTFVQGIVVDSLTRQPITHVPVRLHFENQPSAQVESDGTFYLCVEAGQEVSARVEAPGYLPGRFYLEGPAPAIDLPLEVSVALEPEFNLVLFAEQLQSQSDRQPQKLVESFLFGFDQAALNELLKQRLDAFIETAVKNHSVLTVEVVGYADDIGDDTYNMRLSEARARNVARYLEQKGIAVKKVQVEGRGATRSEETGRPAWQNRKVEVIVYLEE